MQKNYFIAQESSWYSVRKQDWTFLLFVYIKTFRKIIGFCIWMKITMTAIIERQRARLYTQKAKKLRNVFIYKNPDTFQKARQFPFRFYIQKATHLTLRDFHEIFEVGICIQKAWHFALRDVFIYKNLDTSQKARQFAIRFIYKNPALLRYAIFYWIFEISEGGGHLLIN